MNDLDCIQFLQWALPQLRMRWPGFRRVRGQVCKRINRRIQELGLSHLLSYQDYLKQHPDEWPILERMCRVTISRFFRDRRFFAVLESEVLPALAREVHESGEKILRCWSAGCASGEEAYSLSLIWHCRIASDWPGLAMEVIATDVDPVLVQRAKRACYPGSSVHGVPADWLRRAFIQRGADTCLKPEFKDSVRFMDQDIRLHRPPGPFHLILCRNLVFTYFDEGLQREILAGMTPVLSDGGALAIGVHESLPAAVSGFSAWQPGLPVYRKETAPSGP